MDATEQAIDQTMRITLTGADYAIRLSGAGAKELAGALYSIAATQQKTRGKARLESLLKSGKELKVFNISQKELATFAKEAKRYGVLYAVIKGTKDDPEALVDIMVKAEDAAKINRIVEKLEYGRFDETDVVVQSERELQAKGSGKEAAEIAQSEQDADKLLLDEMLGEQNKREGGTAKNPTAAKTGSPYPSEHSSRKDGHRQETSADKDAPKKNPAAVSKTKEGRGFDDRGREGERPSVKEKIEQKRESRDLRKGGKPKDRQTRHMRQGQRRRRRDLQIKTDKGTR